MKRRLGVVLAGTLLLTSVLAGCTSSRSSLGTTDNSCYLALPIASHAVHGKGRLVGIQLYSESSLRKKAPNLSRDLSLSSKAQQKVCVAAYVGRVHQGQRQSTAGPTFGSTRRGRLGDAVERTPRNSHLPACAAPLRPSPRGMNSRLRAPQTRPSVSEFAKRATAIARDKEAPRSTRNRSSVRAEYSIHFEVRQPAITTGNTCLLRFNPSGSLA